MRVITTEYEFSHGKKPRGRGYWAFKVQGDLAVHFIQGELLYSEAVKQFKKKVKRDDPEWIKVCP